MDKLQLIKVLSLGQVLDALETRTRAEHASRGSDIDEGEESYRESLGKLLNVLGVELTKLLEVCAPICPVFAIGRMVSSRILTGECGAGLPDRGSRGSYAAAAPGVACDVAVHGGRVR